MNENLTPEVLSERIQNLKDDSKQMNDKINKLEENVNSIDRNLSDRMLTLETTYRLTTEQINDNIKDVGKQVNTLISRSQEKEEKKVDRNYDWLKSVGLIVVGVFITYIAKKLGL